MGFLNERHGMTLLPTKPGVCPECGVDHPAEQPHNRDTLLYQYTFYDKHGRFPSWADAMEHCEADVKACWVRELKARGVEVGEAPEVEYVNVSVRLGE